MSILFEFLQPQREVLEVFDRRELRQILEAELEEKFLRRAVLDRAADGFFAAAEAALGSIDVLVSNAGVGVPGLIHEVSAADLERELRTNLLGPMWITRRALPAMLAGGRGDLVYVSSMNVVEPRPFQAGYTAGKAGLEGLVHTLRKDLEGTGVRATIVRPGATRSEFGFGWEPDILVRVLDAWKAWGYLRHMDMMDGEQVALAVVHAVTAPPGLSMDVIQVNPERAVGK